MRLERSKARFDDDAIGHSIGHAIHTPLPTALAQGVGAPTPSPLGVTSPLGIGPAPPVTSPGIPLGATELASPGLSSMTVAPANSNCSGAGGAMTGASGASSSFDCTVRWGYCQRNNIDELRTYSTQLRAAGGIGLLTLPAWGSRRSARCRFLSVRLSSGAEGSAHAAQRDNAHVNDRSLVDIRA